MKRRRILHPLHPVSPGERNFDLAAPAQGRLPTGITVGNEWGEVSRGETAKTARPELGSPPENRSYLLSHRPASV